MPVDPAQRIAHFRRVLCACRLRGQRRKQGCLTRHKSLRRSERPARFMFESCFVSVIIVLQNKSPRIPSAIRAWFCRQGNYTRANQAAATSVLRGNANYCAENHRRKVFSIRISGNRRPPYSVRACSDFARPVADIVNGLYRLFSGARKQRAALDVYPYRDSRPLHWSRAPYRRPAEVWRSGPYARKRAAGLKQAPVDWIVRLAFYLLIAVRPVFR